MKVFRTVYNVARADVLERTRQFSFLLMLGITMLAAYFFIPPTDGNYATLYLDRYRGVYNSAWVGSSVAISTTLFLSLFGFYLVKNSIRRDEQTGFGQIIASTSVSKLNYLAGKALSNFTVLSVIVAVIILITATMQLVRGEVLRIELWPMLSPFLFLTLPVMAVVSALAVLFETVKALRGVIGHVIYFSMYIAFISLSAYIPYGTNVITDRMKSDLTLLHPDYSGSFGIGVLTLGGQPMKLFQWQGMDWTPALIGQQLTLLLYAFIIILAASVFFRRFKEVPFTAHKGSKREQSRAAAEQAAAVAAGYTSADTIHAAGWNGFTRPSGTGARAAALSPVTLRNSFFPLVMAEIRLMMKGTRLGWYAVALVLIILGLSMPAGTSAAWMIWPLTWIWPLALWSGMGSREYRYQTHLLVASSPRYLTRQLTAVWLSGVLLACITGSGMLIRFILEGNLESLAYFASAALLIPSLALVSGVMTRTNRTFEVLYMLLWYLGPFNKTPVLDFLGSPSESGTSWAAAMGIRYWLVGCSYLAVSAGLLAAAYLARSRLAKSS
ncbi:hypothetical protein [Paenibacillus sp. MMS20-IR301]|uniref:hypothetical protein n=1 Tax=Paenibacillus sp. MMS20-IR301 TaxID=2895946 RepID=UPI0028F0C39C|nr:hypothetical protein [Paenibacillus sp. MMS20-IR301]WNS40742.1 hypothetical protein LOS79_16925 [Paenibacillus sp. MMS20-IR301]